MKRQQSHRSLQRPEQQQQSEKQERKYNARQFTDEDYAEVAAGTVIGTGRHGRVYRYEDNGTTVAVKDIAVSEKKQPCLERLLREGKILRELCHKNIITLISSSLLKQYLLYVMEFAAGGSLSDVLQKHGRLEPTVATNWAGQISDGMRYLHNKLIVHRDLKSCNILVLEPIDNSGLLGKTMKIADFGLARDGHKKTTAMSEVGGTENYMAPEVRNFPHPFSKASDVYSFGMVVWNLLTGNKPPDDLAKGLEVEMNRLLISPFFERLLKKCCTFDHLDRPTFNDTFGDIAQWERHFAAESTSVPWCREEFGYVLVNLHGSPSSFPALSPKLNKQQPSQVVQLASSSSPSQQQQQNFSFGAASDSFELPVHCRDVALTPDGRSLLLAAWEHGLIELSSVSGAELSRWRPPKYKPTHGSSLLDDVVLAVAALNDGRAAVSLLRAQLVVLLRRNERCSGSSSSSTGGAAAAVVAAACDDVWTEDRRIDLPWLAGCLSAHGDVLAACEWSGRRLQLLSLSSGRLLIPGCDATTG